MLSSEAVSQLVGRSEGAAGATGGRVVTRCANTTYAAAAGDGGGRTARRAAWGRGLMSVESSDVVDDDQDAAEAGLRGGAGVESVKVVDVVDDDQTPLKLDWGRAVSKEQKEKEEKDKQTQGRCPSDAQAAGGAGGAADVAAAHRLAAHADWRGGFANGSVVWAPEKDRYILMDCHRGKSSTRIRCFRNHMLLAGRSNRTLLVPMKASSTRIRCFRNYMLLAGLSNRTLLMLPSPPSPAPPHISPCFPSPSPPAVQHAHPLLPQLHAAGRPL
ncbi:unnamed protein product [Closterium sp. NIES-64]|nr:unnamed protein product [Closterium sp. NIES-64]